MKKIFVSIFFISCALTLKAQQDTSEGYIKLNEVVVSANKFTEQKRNVVQQIDVITARAIARNNAQNMGDLLINTGNVFVQKSQQGGSSPVIRGFEASRVLLVVDGIRMNNAIYRSGHLQNIITVDQNMLERVEIMYGPSSTLFGSDALGGIVHMITRQPLLGTATIPKTSVNAFARYSTANEEKTSHVDLNLGYRKIAFLSSITYSDFGDTKIGANYPKDYPGFGERNQYIVPVNGSFVDSVVNNNNNLMQRFSGYRQWDFMQKVLYKPTDKITNTLNVQLSNSSNVPRYDRLTDTRNGNLRYAEWYYGPQKRNLFAYTFNADKLNGFFDQVRATVSYQDIEESRQTREYRRYDRFDSRRERVKVWGAVVDNRKSFGNNELSLGADAQWNDVKSVADRTNLATGAVSKLDSRYPDGKNIMNYAAIYAQHTLKFHDTKWVLNDGLRLQSVNLSSNIIDNSFFNLPVTNIKQDNIALTGNVGLIYIPEESSRLSIGLSSAFRAPNIDDLAKIFESSTAAKQVVVPNADLKPEYTYNLDIGYRKTFNKVFQVEMTAFYTMFRNAIVKAPFQLNGQDSIIYNGVKSQVLASQNVSRATLFGGNISINAELNTHLSFMTTFTYTRGRYETDDTKFSTIYQQQPDGSYALVQAKVKNKPLDHVPPMFGKTSLQYRVKKGYAELFALYNAFKKLDQYNADGEDNAQYATKDGMPGWYTVNLRLGLNVTKEFQLQAGIENILDRNYRYFASGFSAPGRNFVITGRLSIP